MDYTYDIATIFPGGLELGQLQSAILDESAITSTLVGLFSDSVDLTIRFTAPLSAPELVALAAVISGYVFAAQPTIVPTGSLMSYSLNSLVYRANTTSFSTVGQMAWDNDRYKRYANPTAIILATIYDRNLEWMLYDVTNAVSLGSSIITTSGTTSVAFELPASSTRIELQIRKTALGGQDPEISTTSLEFVN